MVTGGELTRAIRYHRRYHRPVLFAARPGPMRDCGMAACTGILARIRTEGFQRQVIEVPKTEDGDL